MFSCCKDEIEDDNLNDFSADSGTFIDVRDNREYKWVRIGEQIWMAENLAYLPQINTPSDLSLSIARNYIYDYDGNDLIEAKTIFNFITYGVLYNYEAAISSCPEGWHLPADEEWEQLAQFISDQRGPYSLIPKPSMLVQPPNWYSVGGHLQSTRGWYKYGNNGSDDYGFSANPGGFLHEGGTFYQIEGYGSWWSSTKLHENHAYSRYIPDNDSFIRGVNRLNMGNSVRCVKD